MTSGIYKLNFTGTDKAYIGQSVNIERRYKEHICNLKHGRANNKLVEAYRLYGTPTLYLLQACSISELDDLEERYIIEYNSVNNGFNIYANAYEAPTYSGYGYGNTKYSKSKILECVLLLKSDELFSLQEVAEHLEINIGTVSNLSRAESHSWLWEEYPEFKELILTRSKERTLKAYTIVSNKLSAESRGITYPKIRDPKGIYHEISNAYSFAKLNGLAPNHFQEVLNGHRKSHKGWRL